MMTMGPTQAARFAADLARRLGVGERYAIPAYEDTLYHLWKEGGVPINQDPLMAELKLPEARETLRRALERGLDTLVGYALPIEWDDGQGDGAARPGNSGAGTCS